MYSYGFNNATRESGKNKKVVSKSSLRHTFNKPLLNILLTLQAFYMPVKTIEMCGLNADVFFFTKTTMGQSYAQLYS